MKRSVTSYTFDAHRHDRSYYTYIIKQQNITTGQLFMSRSALNLHRIKRKHQRVKVFSFRLRDTFINL